MNSEYFNEKVAIKAFNEHNTKRILEIGRIVSLTTFTVLGFFIISDIFFRNMHEMAYPRIPVILLFIFFHIYNKKNPDKHLSFQKNLFHFILFSLLLMLYTIIFMVWKTDLFMASINGLIVVLFAVFLSSRANLKENIFIFLTPLLIFLFGYAFFLPDKSKIVEFTNPVVIMIGLIIISAIQHRLRKKEFITNKKFELINEKSEKEINLAKKIQKQFIPSSNPAEYISSIYKPMDEVGGDFFDFIKFENSNNIGIFISDVSGHGVPAAFITSMIKTVILQAGKLIYDPAKLLFYMNDILQTQTADNFVTSFYGIYNPEDNSLFYSNAGHHQPYIINSNKITQIQGGKNTAIAMFPNNMLAKANKKFKNFEEKLPVGSKLLLYTDGLVETRPIDSDLFFEYADMEQFFIENSNIPCDPFLKKLMKKLTSFRKSEYFDDDICLICLDVL